MTDETRPSRRLTADDLNFGVDGELNWRALWKLRGPDPEPLSEAVAELIRLHEAGEWRLTEADERAGWRVRNALRWGEDRPMGPEVGEVYQAFLDALCEPLSEPFRRVLEEAACWEPKPPKPATWSTALYAILVGDIQP